MREREVVRESVPVQDPPVVEREVVLDDRPRRGGGGAIAAIVGVVLILILAWFLLQTLGILSDAAEDGDIQPPDTNVNIDS